MTLLKRFFQSSRGFIFHTCLKVVISLRCYGPVAQSCNLSSPNVHLHCGLSLVKYRFADFRLAVKEGHVIILSFRQPLQVTIMKLKTVNQ